MLMLRIAVVTVIQTRLAVAAPAIGICSSRASKAGNREEAKQQTSACHIPAIPRLWVSPPAYRSIMAFPAPNAFPATSPMVL